MALMVLKTLDVLGAQHGYGIARRLEQASGGALVINHGTLYPVLIKLVLEGAIWSEWGTSENNRSARFYSITKAGRRQLLREQQHWKETTRIMEQLLALHGESA